MSKDRLRIAYLCDMSPLNRNLYSGGNARIYDSLRKHAGEVTILSRSWHALEPVRQLIHKTPDAVNLRLRWRMHLALSRYIARGVEKELSKKPYDVLFCAYSFQSLCNVTTPKTMVTAYTSDATQTTYRLSEIGNHYKSWLGIGRRLDGWVERCEYATFHDTDLLLWPSKWQKDLADQRYGLSEAQSRLVPWGANLDTPPPPFARTEIHRTEPVRLLLIGRDWFAKGGPVAFDTMKELRTRGIDARLTVIGCVPPDFHVNEWVTVHPQLDKAVPEDLAHFNAELTRAHFLVQPSYESYGFAYCEASGFGLPSLCLRVGGVPIRNGVNGFALPVGSGPKEFADKIMDYVMAPQDYIALTVAAHTEYEESLNWDAWGRTTTGLLHDALEQKRRGV
ncbi:glycosyltransferase family 4 protein [Tropicibacter sp. S64]|uniref:glycosyltransferase family 4 protein n=1 Tax=Tropicibacter sp. S64 TaxID=3415122 RepID=UPI003C7C2918